MISVIMPAKNAAKTVALALESTLKALPQSGELLVVDDSSSDATGDILSQFKSRDSRVRVLQGTARGGVASSLNLLLAESRHQVIARMDADDFCFPWRFQMQLRALSETRSDLVFSNRVNFGSTLLSFRPSAVSPISSKESPFWLAVTNPVAHSTLMAKKSALLNAGGYVPGPAEDYELWMRLAADGAQIIRTARPAIGYRLHPNQVTKESSWLSEFNSDSNLIEAHDRLIKSIGWTGESLWLSLHGGQVTTARNLALSEFKTFLLSEFPSSNLSFRLAAGRMIR